MIMDNRNKMIRGMADSDIKLEVVDTSRRMNQIYRLVTNLRW